MFGYDYNYNRYGEGNTGRLDYAHNLYDSTLDRAWTYDHVGRLTLAYTGTEANAIWGNPTGPYAQSFTYDPWGDITARAGWGGANASYAATFTSKNQMLTNPGNGQAFTYDAAGNITYDGGQAFTYDAAGKQVTSSWNGLQQSYDGDGLRGKKVMDGVATYYLHSSVLGGQVVAEINASGGWTRGYVYLGGQMVAIQQSGVTWVHQEPVTKGQRLTDSNGSVTSTIELDPFGGDTSRTVNGATQPHTFTTYERDTTGGMDEAMMRRYHGWWSRFDQPDPYDGSFDFADPQSFNRYSYVQNDPVNFGDPTGLYAGCVHRAMTNFLAKLTGRYTDQQAAKLGQLAGSDPGGADSFKYSATNPINILKGFFGRGPSAQIHFASEATLNREIANFGGYMALGDYQSAAFVTHSVEDVHGAHQGFHLPFGHAFANLFGKNPDIVIGDEKFLRAANEVYQLLSGDKSVSLTPQQVNDLIDAIIAECGKDSKKLKITRPAGGGHGNGLGSGSTGGGGGGWVDDDPFRWLDWWWRQLNPPKPPTKLA